MKIFRPLFFALLLANVIFFAWSHNVGPNTGHEPQRIQQQISPEKLKIVGEEAPAPPKPAPQPAAAEAAPVAAASAVLVAASTAAAAPAPAPVACKAFNDLSLESAKAAQADIEKVAPTIKTSLQAVKENGSYWVFIPPQANKAAADKKVGELKQMGVDESFILVDEGPSRFAISLGLFRSKETAEAFLQSLNKKGVRSAKIEAREKGSEKARLEIHAPADTLTALQREIKPLNGASAVDCKAG